MDASDHFRGKKITVMGLGLLGRGIGDARYLASCGAELIVTDKKSADELASSVAELREFPNITFVLGEHRLEDFQGRDLILKAAGVPLDSPYIEEAKKTGTSVRMSADLFVEYAEIPTVGITGTRGKSTVTHMIAAILQDAGKKPVLGGNVRGVSTLGLLPDIQGDEIAVLELDSWQCQGFGDAGMSPSVAVFTTFMRDHMNYYKDDMGAYLEDKAKIFLNQKPGDTLVVGEQAKDVIVETYRDQINGTMIVAGQSDLPPDWHLRIPGVHNRYNAAVACAAARALGVSDDVSRTALESFTGLPGRIELVREVNGIQIYNDTNATTPEATIAALQALDPTGAKNIILIMGGADKGLDMSPLWDEILVRTKDLYFLKGSGIDRIRPEAPHVPEYSSLKEAFDAAMSGAVSGDIVLLSPAFASFGMFKNEYDRGDQFTALAKTL